MVVTVAASRRKPTIDRIQEELRFRATPLQLCHPVGDSGSVRHARQHPTFLPSGIAEHLRYCTQFKTLPDHVADICLQRSDLRSDPRGVRAILDDCVSRGLLISEDQLCEHGVNDAWSRRSIGTVAVITAERMSSCEEAVRSIVHVSQLIGRRVNLVVMDDSSAGSKAPERLQQYLRTVRTGGSVMYAARPERELYVRKLATCGIDPQVARFALLGYTRRCITTVGSNRNSLLLDTLGESICMMDDDILLRIARPPDFSNRLRILCDQNPRDFWFFRHRNDAVEHLEWSTADIFAEHEAMLGLPVSALLRDARRSHGVSFDDTCDHLVSGLLGHTAAITMTANGIAGDSGFGTAPWVFSPEGPTRDKLLRSESLYSTALRSKEILGVARWPTINHSCWCMAGSIGLDNRAQLPPFLPIGRAEDWVFGTLLFRCFPHYFTGHIPLAVLHNSQGKSSYHSTPLIRISDLVRHLISSLIRQHRTYGYDKLRVLGKCLRDLSMLPLPDLCTTLAEVVRQQQMPMMNECDKMLAKDDVPSYWKRDLHQWHRQLIALLDDPLCFVPAEFREHLPAETAIASTKELIGQTGDLFYNWPDLVKASADLQRKGYRIGRSIA